VAAQLSRQILKIGIYVLGVGYDLQSKVCAFGSSSVGARIKKGSTAMFLLGPKGRQLWGLPPAVLRVSRDFL